MTRRLRTPVPTVAAVLAVVALLVACATAAAHQLVVLQPGGGEIDAGTGDPPRLVHATLERASQRLEIAVQPTAGASEAVLYVPDQRPERRYRGAELPTLRVAGGRGTTGVVAGTADGSGAGDVVVDEATGIAYREVARLALRRGAPSQVVVTRGSAPARVAVRVGPPTTFAADDLEQTPKLAVRTRLWAEQPPAGTVESARVDHDSRARYAWFGALLTAIAVLTAIWWVARGRSAARRRGHERNQPPPPPPTLPTT